MVHLHEENTFRILPPQIRSSLILYLSTVLLTDLVELAVQPRHLVMQQMPSEALKVKEQQAGQHLDQQNAEWRSLLGQMYRNQKPAHQCQWEDENQVVVERQEEAAEH